MEKLIFQILLLLIFVSGVKSQLVQSNFQGVIVPQNIASGGTTRLPYIFRATVTGLEANSKYRYYSNACRYTDFGGTNSGAGNPIFINGSNFRYSTSTGLSTAGGYDSIFTDAAGNYTGWFGFVHTGNARFTAGNYVYPTITLDSVGNGSTKYRFALSDSILVLGFSDSATATSGTGLYGISLASPKNVIATYNNVNGTGRPLSMVYVESDGIDTTVMTSLVQYYKDSVDSRNGRWGTVIPNVLSAGVRRINVFRLTNASIANFQTDDDGVWPSGVNTVNPHGGSLNPLRMDIQDAPLIIQVGNSVPDNYSLEQNYPNPFNPETVIRYSLTENRFTTLKVFDPLGKEVATLVNEKQNAGMYEVNFNGSKFASGVYFYKLETGNFTDTKRMILIK